MSGLPRKKCTPKRASSNRAEHKTVQTFKLYVHKVFSLFELLHVTFFATPASLAWLKRRVVSVFSLLNLFHADLYQRLLLRPVVIGVGTLLSMAFTLDRVHISRPVSVVLSANCFKTGASCGLQVIATLKFNAISVQIQNETDIKPATRSCKKISYNRFATTFFCFASQYRYRYLAEYPPIIYAESTAR